MSRPSGISLSIWFRNLRSSSLRWRAVMEATAFSEAVSRAANRSVVPWRRHSRVCRWGVPAISGRIGAVRSRACMEVFSSTHSTAAASGGFRYKPTTSRTLSTNCGSGDTLCSSTRWGLRPNARHVWLTAVWETPAAAPTAPASLAPRRPSPPAPPAVPVEHPSQPPIHAEDPMKAHQTPKRDQLNTRDTRARRIIVEGGGELCEVGTCWIPGAEGSSALHNGRQ